MTSDRTVIVVYALGAASPMEIVHSAADVASVIFVVDTRDPHVQQVRRTISIVAPCLDLADGYSSVIEGLRAMSPAGILTFSEPALETCARLAADLGLPYHRPDTLIRLTDKVVQRAALNECGASAVSSRWASTAEELGRCAAAVGFPCVIKPVRGQSSRATIICRDHADLQRAEDFCHRHSAYGPWAVEQMIAGGVRPLPWLADYVSVESAVSGESVWHFSVTDKLPLVPPVRERGGVTPTALDPQTRLAVEDVATRAIKAMGIRGGIVHTEVKLATSGPQVIEVNGRLGGGVASLVRRSCDLDVVRLAIEMSLGAPIPRTVPQCATVAARYYGLAPEGRYVLRGIRLDVIRNAGEAVRRVDLLKQVGDIVDSAIGTQDAVFAVHLDSPSRSAIELTVERLHALSSQAMELAEPPMG